MEFHISPSACSYFFGKIDGSVGLVSFQFRSISAFEVWTFGLAEMFFPFGHSFWAILLSIWAFEQMLIVWVVVFWATKEPRQGPRRD
jgi:hypothetical protein